jgi:hypothetical protein
MLGLRRQQLLLIPTGICLFTRPHMHLSIYSSLAGVRLSINSPIQSYLSPHSLTGCLPAIALHQALWATPPADLPCPEPPAERAGCQMGTGRPIVQCQIGPSVPY